MHGSVVTVAFTNRHRRTVPTYRLVPKSARWLVTLLLAAGCAGEDEATRFKRLEQEAILAEVRVLTWERLIKEHSDTSEFTIEAMRDSVEFARRQSNIAREAIEEWRRGH